MRRLLSVLISGGMAAACGACAGMPTDGPDGGEQVDPTSVTVHVFADRPTNDVRNRVGLLSGDADLGSHADAVALVTALAPAFRRFGQLGTHWFGRSLGTPTHFQLIVDDGFQERFGRPVRVAPSWDPATEERCFDGYADLASAFRTYVDDLMAELAAAGAVIDSYDLMKVIRFGNTRLTEPVPEPDPRALPVSTVDGAVELVVPSLEDGGAVSIVLR